MTETYAVFMRRLRRTRETPNNPAAKRMVEDGSGALVFVNSRVSLRILLGSGNVLAANAATHRPEVDGVSQEAERAHQVIKLVPKRLFYEP